MIFVQQVSVGSWVDWSNVFHLLGSKYCEFRYVSCSFKCVRVILKVIDLDHVLVVFIRYFRRADNELFVSFNVL